jgi:hypothetical protein
MSTVVSKNVQIGADGTASNNFTAYQPAAPDGTLRIGNGNSGSVTDAITLTSAGNVGIGTNSPGARLQVTSAVSGSYGAIIYNTHATGQGLTVRGGSTSSQDAFNVQTYDGGTSLLSVQAGGNVGIGTSSPAANLDLRASGVVSQYLISNSGSNQQNQIVSLYNSGAGYGSLNIDGLDLRFKISNSEHMRIDSSGNVGIGTSSPTQQLTIEGAMNLRNGSRAGAFEIDSSGNLWMGTATTAGSIIFESGHTTTGLPSTGVERARIDSDGLKFNGDTAAANALDDYEEGTFTVFARDEDNNAQTYYESPGQYNRGHYVKIGQYVYFTIQMYTSGSGSTVGTQAVKITGLPFTAATVGGNGNVGSCTFPYFSDSSGGVGVFVGSVTEGGTSIYIQKTDTNGVTSAATITNWSTPRLSAVGWYRAAA